MRQKAWDEVKIALNDYPRLDWYIRQVKQDILFPYRVTDGNIGGSSGTRRHDQLEGTVVRMSDNTTIKRLEFQKYIIQSHLDSAPDWLKMLIEYMYFTDNKVSFRNACELVDKNWKTAKKYYNEFMEDLAGDLGILKF